MQPMGMSGNGSDQHYGFIVVDPSAGLETDANGKDKGSSGGLPPSLPLGEPHQVTREAIVVP